MNPQFDAKSLSTLRLTDLDARYWSFERAAHVKLHEEFLAAQLAPSSYELHGLRFLCPSGVYHPTEESSTRFILRGILPFIGSIGEKVLDVGTGCGAIGAFMANAGKRVTAIDIDELAIECAKANAAANGAAMKIVRSDMFDALPDRDFDFMVFNAPLADKPIEHPAEQMACDPEGALLRRFLQEAPRRLSPAGAVAFLTSNLGPRQVTLASLSAYDHYLSAADYRADCGVWRWLIIARPKERPAGA